MQLTQKERDTLRLLAIGSTRGYAAVLTQSSPSTIARTTSSLYARTGAVTTIELISFLIVAGVLDLTAEDFPDCSLPDADPADPYSKLAETEPDA